MRASVRTGEMRKSRVEQRLLVTINLPDATFGLVIDDGIVTSAPPIARWAKGEEFDKVICYYQERGAEVEVRMVRT